MIILSEFEDICNLVASSEQICRWFYFSVLKFRHAFDMWHYLENKYNLKSNGLKNEARAELCALI